MDFGDLEHGVDDGGTLDDRHPITISLCQVHCGECFVCTEFDGRRNWHSWRHLLFMLEKSLVNACPVLAADAKTVAISVHTILRT